MAHVEGHPEDRFRKFIEHSSDSIIGPIAGEAKLKDKRDKSGRRIREKDLSKLVRTGRLAARLSPTIGGLAATALLQEPGTADRMGREVAEALERLKKERLARTGGKGWVRENIGAIDEILHAVFGE